ncbi:MAG: hypothetical protein WCG26_12585, partial [Chloroflexales bacterium]
DAAHAIPRAQQTDVGPARDEVLDQHQVGRIVLDVEQRIAVRCPMRMGQRECRALDRVGVRLSAAQADQVIDVTSESLDEALGEANINVLVEATGSMPALAGALPLLANHGRVLLLGYYDHINIPYAPVFMREAQVLVAREWQFGPDGDLPHVRDLIASGELDVEGLLTHRVPLDRIQAAYRLAFEDPSCLKLVVEWPTDGAAWPN